MARNYGTYTPARRAALRRAQYISAQKRHSRRRKFKAFAHGTGVVAGTIAISAATHWANKALKQPREFGRDVAYVKGVGQGAIRRIRGENPSAGTVTAAMVRHNHPLHSRRSVRYSVGTRHRSVAGRRVRR